MGFKTAVICTVATLIAIQFLPAQYAFILGAMVILLPLRLTILPGNFPSWTGALASLATIASNTLGLSILQCLLIGSIIGPISLWAGLWFLSGKFIKLS